MDLVRVASNGHRPKAPSPEDVELRFSERAVKELELLLSHYPDKKSAMLPALWIAQREYGGWLPSGALAEVALRLGRSYAEVEGVATFYTMYKVGHQLGRHAIEVCTNLTCHLCGVYGLAAYIKAKLGIDWGETTPDGQFTLEEVECLDACDRAPVLQIGDTYHGPVDEAFFDKLIEELQNEPDSTAIHLADEIVRVQLLATDVASI